jgi:hypothetical protein
LARIVLRVASLSVRIVPCRKAVSGMMFVVVPAVTLAMVTTAGSKMSIRRVTIVCSASVISAATAIGSTAWWGAEACPPLPRTVIRIVSPAASSGPRRRLTVPLRKFVLM